MEPRNAWRNARRCALPGLHALLLRRPDDGQHHQRQQQWIEDQQWQADTAQAVLHESAGPEALHQEPREEAGHQEEQHHAEHVYDEEEHLEGEARR